jgi:hypothetical protein
MVAMNLSNMKIRRLIEAHAIGNEHGSVVSRLDREVDGPSAVRMFQIPQGKTLLRLFSYLFLSTTIFTRSLPTFHDTMNCVSPPPVIHRCI